MNILGLILARSGSKGVPGKNMKILGGKPLLEYTIDTALDANGLEDIVLSTDSKSYADFAKSKGISVPFIRPAKLAEDKTPAIDVVIHALESLAKMGKYYDAICLLQPTYPFREKGSIDRAIGVFEQSESDALISVLPVPQEFNPHWVFVPTEDGLLNIATGEKEIIKRRQELPKALFRDGSIYLTKTEIILQKRSLYGDKIGYIENSPTFYVNIDTPEDWFDAEEKLPQLKALI
jgi:CMP-N,N'-diacetyllegionaminic acid synthase